MTEAALDKGRSGEVITFYSFKGGVGRSMALANVATIYAQQGKRVLALDFDFEAPGLHRYFLTKDPERYTPAGPQNGVLNLFDALRDRLRTSFPYEQDLEGAEAQSKTRAMVAELLDSGTYKYTVRLKNPNVKNAPPADVDFVAAARFDATHPELLRAFDWQDFYDDYFGLFPAIVSELRSRYDVVLIDSRTGVTDIGSICTMVLPDKLVLVFTTNEQSLAGALDAGWQAVQGRKEAPEPRVMPIFPLVSRVEEGEEEQKRKWIADARGRFERLFKAAYEVSECDLGTYFNIVRVSHRGYFAYGERIAAEEQPVAEAGGLAWQYGRLVDCLAYHDAEEAQLAFQRRNEVVKTLKDASALLLVAKDSGVAAVKDAMPRALAMLAGALEASTEYGAAAAAYEKQYEMAHGNTSKNDAAPNAVDLLHKAGFARLCEAKQVWRAGDPASARVSLTAASEKLFRAAELAPEDPTLLHHAGYSAFLLDRSDEARDLLTKAIALGGAGTREGALKDAAVSSLPQDAAFRALLASIPDPPPAAPTPPPDPAPTGA